jgi:hypothetical protein
MALTNGAATFSFQKDESQNLLIAIANMKRGNKKGACSQTSRAFRKATPSFVISMFCSM